MYSTHCLRCGRPLKDRSRWHTGMGKVCEALFAAEYDRAYAAVRRRHEETYREVQERQKRRRASMNQDDEATEEEAPSVEP